MPHTVAVAYDARWLKLQNRKKRQPRWLFKRPIPVFDVVNYHPDYGTFYAQSL